MDTLTTRKQAPLAVPVATEQLLAAFADWMRLDVAEGDASPETIRTYWSQVSYFLNWCEDQGIHPALATVEDVKDYRATLIREGYARATMASKLNVVRRFYAMAQARGYRSDNPAQGVKAPRDLTHRSERVKWLPLVAIQEVIDAPDTSTTKGRRDRAILILLALHGLRVAEVAGLEVEDLDVEASVLTVLGKGRKQRSVDLVEPSKAAVANWLEVREDVAHSEETALFVSVRDRRGDGPGRAMGRRGIRKMVVSYLEALGLKREGELPRPAP